jgi:hypothetical protein
MEQFLVVAKDALMRRHCISFADQTTGFFLPRLQGSA